MVASLRLQDFVTFEGFCEDVWPHYRRADIAMVPSRWEPFGNTAVEAQLAGVPVVVTSRQGLPETVADGAFGSIVDADDHIALADAVEGLLRDWPSAIQRAETAKVVASGKFSIERYRSDVAAAVEAALRPGLRGTNDGEAV
jgi:glycosyltransferase involved in cell wall biosynthesis